MIFAFILLVLTVLFWILAETGIHWKFKIASFIVASAFLLSFVSILSFLGWGASFEGLEETELTIHAATIVRPSERRSGAIYIVAEEPRIEYRNLVLKVLGKELYKGVPRMYELDYTPELEETIRKKLLPLLRDGKRVDGKLSNDPKQKGGVKSNPRLHIIPRKNRIPPKSKEAPKIEEVVPNRLNIT